MTSNEKNEYNKIIKNILIFSCQKLNLNISCNKRQYYYYYNNNNAIHNDQIKKTLTDSTTVSSIDILINGVDFLKNNYTPFISTEKVSPISFEPHIGNQIWDYADSILENSKDKDIFFKYMQNCNNDNFTKIINTTNDERFFKYLDSCIPKQTEKCYLENFKHILPLLKNRKYETTEQKNMLFRFSKHYKKIIKRPDITPVFCDLISQKIPTKEHEPFEKIIGRKITLGFETSIDDIMALPTTSLTLPLKKDKLFERINITGLDIPSVLVMNKIHEKIVTSFNSENIKKMLGLVDTHFIEFYASHNKGKMVFEFTSKNHRLDMPFIYLTCLQSCAKNYSNKFENYNDIIERTLTHYLLEQNLSDKKESSTFTRKI